MDSTLREMTSHNGLHGLLYQASAEYIALCVQAYRLARHAVMDRLVQGIVVKPAVVFDLDETVFNNSAYQAWQIRAGRNFDEGTSWKQWCDEGRATAVPGAVEFVRFIESKNIVPIFITSRQNVTRTGTAENLRRLELISDEECERERLNGNSSSHALSTRLFMFNMPAYTADTATGKKMHDLTNKFQARIFCEQVRGFEIILSVGDNLADYAEAYGSVVSAAGTVIRGTPFPAARISTVLQDLPLFGRDFVLIPNATYGGWLRAYEGNLLGASDELASTGSQVREPLEEPQESFVFDGTKSVKANGPKFSPDHVVIWNGPT
jgi:predicted secreted acid phosphatase